jgi:hypothetical protein
MKVDEHVSEGESIYLESVIGHSARARLRLMAARAFNRPKRQGTDLLVSSSLKIMRQLGER